MDVPRSDQRYAETVDTLDRLSMLTITSADNHVSGPDSSHAGYSSESTSDTDGSDEDSDSTGSSAKEADTEPLNLDRLWPVQAREFVVNESRGKHKQHKSHKKLPKETQRTNKERRKERIAAKRAERAKVKGFDVRLVDRQLSDMVESGLDVYAFPPMGDWGLKTTQQMAACYGLKGTVSGSTKKRFVMVRTTNRAGLPNGDQLEALIAIKARAEVTHMEVCESQQAEIQAKKHKKKKKAPARKDIAVIDENPSGMYAVPISFVSGGVQASLELVRQSESTADVPCERASSQHSDSSSSDSEHEPVRRGLGVTASAMPNSLVQENEDASNGARSSGSSESDSEPASMGLGASKPSYSSAGIQGKFSNANGFGAFERHTSGFGSKMLSKMGFIPGGGLGASGQGIATPLESEQRAKRLGLGAELGGKPV